MLPSIGRSSATSANRRDRASGTTFDGPCRYTKLLVTSTDRRERDVASAIQLVFHGVDLVLEVCDLILVVFCPRQCLGVE